MSKKIRGFHRLAAPALLVGLVIPLTGGCSSDSLDPTSCAANLEVKVESLQAAADALVEVAGEMKVSVGTACAAIASAGGEDPGAAITADSSDEDVQAVCGKAEAAISANLSAAGSVSLTIEGGKCEVAAEAQLNCEASCSVEGECNPGTVEARCEPGELSVSCEGSCAGGATCQGSAEVAANCEGSCSGSCEGTIEGGCEGTCSGTCEGTCEGKCDGQDSSGTCAGTCEGTCSATCTGTCTKPAASATCTGKCTGECKLAADADIECGANVSCKGECKGTATAPKCEANLEPPECDLDADCQAGCKGQASLKAECTPPKVIFNFTGDVDASFVAALEANLPALLNVVAQGELAVTAAADFSARFVDVAGEVVAAAGCVAKFGASLVAKAEASVKASASVSVSVNASASASGSASGGGG